MRETRNYKMENFVGGGEGTEFERDIFGEADTKNPEYQKELQKVAKPNGFVFFRDATRVVKKFQSGDPRNPERPFVHELRMEIIELLNLLEEKDMDRVKFYTATETPLDKWHGIDGFFEIEQENGPPIIITLDATTVTIEEKIQRGQKIKADIVISAKELDLANEKTLPEKISGIAKEIVGILKSKEDEINKRIEEKEGKHHTPKAIK